MQTHLADHHAKTPAGRRAQALLQACVHCGFCNATCPTYQLTGNELDGPRGRIYLMKQVFEGDQVSAVTRNHLDRCLVCRSCETTCPSGVRYAELLTLGREAVQIAAPRSWRARALRALLRRLLTGSLFASLYQMGQLIRPLLPRTWQRMMRADRVRPLPASSPSARRVLVPLGCVQPTLLGGVDAALVRILTRLDIEAVTLSAGCCGAVAHHTDDADGSLVAARRNIDAWWPFVESGVEAIIWTASACGLEVRDYGVRFANDPQYAVRATRISALVCDPGEFLLRAREQLAALEKRGETQSIAFHPPCTLQHGLRAHTAVEKLLVTFGARLVPVPQSHMCCGSAGTYSILQPEFAELLGREKIKNLMTAKPSLILSANVGCIVHLRAEAPIPVRHWLEWLDEQLETCISRIS